MDFLDKIEIEKNIRKRPEIPIEPLRYKLIRAYHNIGIANHLYLLIHDAKISTEKAASIVGISTEDVDLFMNLYTIIQVSIGDHEKEIVLRMIQAGYDDDEIMKLTDCEDVRLKTLRKIEVEEKAGKDS